MKKFIALTVALLTVSAFAGNRQMTFTTGFNAATEAGVVAAVEAALPEIQEGNYKPLRRDMRYSQCWPMRSRDLKVGSLSISKIYKVTENGTLSPVFIGRLSVTHKSCRDND